LGRIETEYGLVRAAVERDIMHAMRANIKDLPRRIGLKPDFEDEKEWEMHYTEETAITDVGEVKISKKLTKIFGALYFTGLKLNFPRSFRFTWEWVIVNGKTCADIKYDQIEVKYLLTNVAKAGITTERRLILVKDNYTGIYDLRKEAKAGGKTKEVCEIMAALGHSWGEEETGMAILRVMETPEYNDNLSPQQLAMLCNTQAI
jgi:hypothetical protein